MERVNINNCEEYIIDRLQYLEGENKQKDDVIISKNKQIDALFNFVFEQVEYMIPRSAKGKDFQTFCDEFTNALKHSYTGRKALKLLRICSKFRVEEVWGEQLIEKYDESLEDCKDEI